MFRLALFVLLLLLQGFPNTLPAQPCSTITAPFSEDFDGPNWMSGSGVSNTGDMIGPCWSRTFLNSLNFSVGSGPTVSGGTGPSSDFSGNGNYIYVEGSTVNNYGLITSPTLSIPDSASSSYFKFAYHLYGGGIDSLIFEIDTGNAFYTVYSIVGQQQLSSTAAWVVDSFDISSYIGTSFVCRLTGYIGSFQGDIAVDEVAITARYQCAPPTNLTVNNSSFSSLNLAWNSVSTSQTSQLIYYPANSGPSSSTQINNVSSPFNLTGLQSGTDYVIRIIDSCGSFQNPAIQDTFSTQACPPVTAAFNQNSSFLGVNFDASSSTNADSVFWDFGNGNNDTLINSAQQYDSAGTYAVTLFVFNNCGSSDTLVQNITLCDTLVAGFTQSVSGDSVFFNPVSGNNASGFIWDLDEGNSSTRSSPVVSYDSTGSKTVSLTVYNNCGDSSSVSKNIQVCPPPKANWTYEIIQTTGSGQQVQFDGRLSVNATSYSWDFGDGNTATGPMPMHTYITPGLFYQVKLTVANSCGNTDVFEETLNNINVGLDDVAAQKSITAYPNPVKEFLKLEWNSKDFRPTKAIVLNSQGQLVLSKSLNPKRQEHIRLDLHTLSPGYYILLVQTPDGPKSFRIVKEAE